MKSFFLHAEVEDDREMLASVLSRHFEMIYSNILL